MRLLWLAVVLVGALLGVTACNDDGTAEQPPIPPEPLRDDPVVTEPAGEAGEAAVIELRVEDVDAVAVEGFEAALRIETADGEVLERLLWTDLVAAQDPSTPVSAYDLVHEQVVPPGEIVVLAQVALGIGPPPATPDLDGELPCEVNLELAADDVAVIELRLVDSPDCLQLIET